MAKPHSELRGLIVARGLPDPYARFKAHAARAKKRGIEFKLTFEQWWSLWEADYHRRGTGALDMCMCRHGDSGAYEMGNVRIATNKENQHEKILEQRCARAQRRTSAREYRRTITATQWFEGRCGDTDVDLNCGDGYSFELDGRSLRG